MGVGASSKQRLGERVQGACKKLAADMKMQAERAARIKAVSPETLDVFVQSITDAFERCAPFSDATLLVAFEANPEEVQRVLAKACKKVLSAPVRKREYAWFQRHVFASTVWMQRNQRGELLFEQMLQITQGMADKVELSMRNIYDHLRTHSQWQQLLAIQDQTVVARQDDARVGLLLEKGIREVAEAKRERESGDGGADADDVATFIDSNLAVNMLTTTAKRLNGEFQSRMRALMSRFGDFKAGPLKTVERCQAKLENDYADAAYPKAAKLLDVVRCSVSFNTLEQLLAGYDGLRRHVASSDALQLARVKNGFLDEAASYRDLKVNVVCQSETEPDSELRMVCEVQLILNQYLFEKKRSHKLYDILRERRFFDMVVKQDTADDAAEQKDLKNLQFEPVLNVKEHVFEYKNKTRNHRHPH